MSLDTTRTVNDGADPLADVLRSVRLTGAIFLHARFTAPWCVTARLTAEECRPFLENPAQVIAFHFVTGGQLLLSLEDEPAIEVSAGEIVLLPGNDRHVLASQPGLEPIEAGTLIQPASDGGLARIRYGGGGDAAELVCGFLGTAERHNPLIATLPKTLKIDVREGASREWIEASVRFAANEIAEGRLASSGMLSRLSELLFVEAVRNYLATLPHEDAGWLKGLKDPHVGRALSLIHRNIDKDWTAERLARDVALSRSAFVERFGALVGMPPIRYLTVCRLQAARLALAETAKPVGQIARAVGYESEEAFSRAFKREFGMSPTQWREKGPAQPTPDRAITP